MAGSVNKVILVGNLGGDPEVRRLNSGAAVVNLRIATSESWRDKTTGERQERTEWHNVVIYNENLGKIAEQYLKKGSKVYVEGQLQTRKWQDQSGQDKYTTEVVLQRFRGELTLLDARRRRRRSRRTAAATSAARRRWKAAARRAAAPAAQAGRLARRGTRRRDSVLAGGSQLIRQPGAVRRARLRRPAHQVGARWASSRTPSATNWTDSAARITPSRREVTTRPVVPSSRSMVSAELEHGDARPPSPARSSGSGRRARPGPGACDDKQDRRRDRARAGDERDRQRHDRHVAHLVAGERRRRFERRRPSAARGARTPSRTRSRTRAGRRRCGRRRARCRGTPAAARRTGRTRPARRWRRW